MADTIPRFLLDQGFPKPPFDVTQWDKNVAFVHLSDHDRTLSNTSTPDWMVVLAADTGGFTGLITRDRSELNEPETLIALEATDISIVTWTKGTGDTVLEWGMLLAYMPQILKRIEQHDHQIFSLPSPRLGKDNVQKKADASSRVARNLKVPYRTMRKDATDLMKRQLASLNRLDLVTPLDRPRRSKGKGTIKPKEPKARSLPEM